MTDKIILAHCMPWFTIGNEDRKQCRWQHWRGQGDSATYDRWTIEEGGVVRYMSRAADADVEPLYRQWRGFDDVP